MSYTNALQVFFERLNYKHGLKGESFRTMEMWELDEILLSEIQEWKDADNGTHEEVYELADIMVSCVLKLEQLLTPKKEDEEP